MKFIFFIFYCLLIPTGFNKLYAHPTTYEGGFSIMSEMSKKKQETLFIYSAKYWLGTGLVFVKSPDTPYLISSQIGFLIKRWNLPSAQGNIYFFGGLAHFLENKTRLIYRLGGQLDYETRRIYSFIKYTEHRFFENNKEIQDELNLAFGVAPYVAEFDELNSWIIVKVVISDRFNKKSYVSLLRFFYKNFLWEIGQSLNGNPEFNFMIRF